MPTGTAIAPVPEPKRLKLSALFCTFRSTARCTKQRELCELDFFENATNAPRARHVELLAIAVALARRRLDGRL